MRAEKLETHDQGKLIGNVTTAPLSRHVGVHYRSHVRLAPALSLSGLPANQTDQSGWKFRLPGVRDPTPIFKGPFRIMMARISGPVVGGIPVRLRCLCSDCTSRRSETPEEEKNKASGRRKTLHILVPVGDLTCAISDDPKQMHRDGLQRHDHDRASSDIRPSWRGHER